MRRFVFGFIAGIIVLPAAALGFARLGFVDPRADIPVGALERRIAMPSLDASVERRAPEAPASADSSGDALLAGMKVYEANCALCHGDGAHPDAALADALYPRAPRFVREAPDMPEYENLYIIEHGVRMTGMPAWGRILPDSQLRQVTTFLAHMDHLPAALAAQWKAGAALPP